MSEYQDWTADLTIDWNNPDGDEPDPKDVYVTINDSF